MNLNFFDLDSLQKELEKLPPLHRVAFAAACCERLIPNYNAFCRIENWGNSIVPRKALDEVWQILHGQQVNPIKIARLKADCGSEDVCPDLDNNYDFYYCWEAQEALIASDNTRSPAKVILNR